MNPITVRGYNKTIDRRCSQAAWVRRYSNQVPAISRLPRRGCSTTPAPRTSPARRACSAARAPSRPRAAAQSRLPGTLSCSTRRCAPSIVIESPSCTKRDQPAHLRFRRDVPHHQAVGAAREASVGDEPDRIAQSRADDCRGRRQHLAHPGSALGPFVADHQHVAGFDLAVRGSLRANPPRDSNTRAGPVIWRLLIPGDLRDRAFGGEVAAQDREMPLRVHRTVPRMDHVLILARRRRALRRESRR